MKLGVSSYSYSQYINQGKLDMFSCIAKAKEMGFDAIEFTDLNPPEGETQIDFADRLKKEAERCDIEISAYVIGANLAKGSEEERKEEIERVKGQVDVAHHLGCKLFRHDVMYNYSAFRSFKQALPYIAESARQITEYAETLGIRTMTENHGIIFQDPERMEALMEAVNHKNYGLLLDLGNFLCADVSPETAVSKLYNYAFMVHAKDFVVHPYSEKTTEGFQSRGCNRLVGVSVGEGNANTEQSLAILQNVGFDGNIDIEYEGSGDCILGIEKSRDKIKEIWK